MTLRIPLSPKALGNVLKNDWLLVELLKPLRLGVLSIMLGEVRDIFGMGKVLLFGI